MEKVAFLVFPPFYEERRKNSSFDGMMNIGAYMLIDVARRAGIDVGFCSVDTAREWDIVCVSLTSPLDVLGFYKATARHPDWKKPRRFRVLVGGFGMQNPRPLQDLADEFWFGRCENEFVEWLKNRDYEHPSLFRFSNPKVCKINQTKKSYPHELKLKNNGSLKERSYQETLMGCPHKCFFCHYSWARKHIHGDRLYSLDIAGNSQELDMFNWHAFNPEVSHLNIGMDGLSEKTRFFVNKKITDSQIAEMFVKLSERAKSKRVLIKLYNITGFETDEEADIEVFAGVLNSISEKIKTPLSITMHTTPLTPSPATPIAFAPINVRAQISIYTRRENPIIYTTSADWKSAKIIASHSVYNPSPKQTLYYLACVRFTEKYFPLLDTICFNRKVNGLKTMFFLKAIEDHFDITDLVREYDTEEELPSWMCESYLGWEAVKNARRCMKKKLLTQ